MEKRKGIASIFIVIALVLGVVFYLNIDYPENFEGYFKKS